MSHKVSLFATTVFMPLTTATFLVNIRGLLTGDFTAQTASFPGLKTQETSLFYRGREISIPIRADYGPGEWTVVLPDNVLGVNGFAMQENVLNQLNPSIVGSRSSLYDVYDIEVTPLFGNIPVILQKAVLKGCYVKKIDDVALDASNPANPWRWQVTFKYNAVKHVVANSFNVAKKISKILR